MVLMHAYSYTHADVYIIYNDNNMLFNVMQYDHTIFYFVHDYLLYTLFRTCHMLVCA